MEINCQVFKDESEAHRQAKRLVDEGWSNLVCQMIDDMSLNIKYYYNFANCPITNDLYIFDKDDNPILLNKSETP